MLTSKAIVQLERPIGAMLLNLPKFPSGFSSAFDRIPDQRGVYAFFPYQHYPDDADALFEAIIADIERKKFADRQTTLAPYYGITLESKTSLSQTKLPHLKKALKNDDFRRDLIETLGNSLLFQSPLYLGKSKSLRGRIRQHLESSSDLRERLAEAGYDIERTSILVIPSFEEPTDASEEVEGIDADGLTEEILSRLFHIHFTLRLG
jgi:hypothetical protein